MKSILDFRPALLEGKEFQDSGAEPSLRDLVFRYYDKNFEPATAIQYARDYCSQIEQYDCKRILRCLYREQTP